jgi:hypothetical protein
VKVSTKGIAGSVNKHITVFSNDPDTPQIALAVRGQIKHYVALNPRVINFWGTPDRKLVRKVGIIPAKEVKLQIKQVRSTISNEVKHTLNIGEKEGEYLLTVENIRTIPGRYHGNIIMETNLPEKPELILKVYGNIQKPESIRKDEGVSPKHSEKSATDKAVTQTKRKQGGGMERADAPAEGRHF